MNGLGPIGRSSIWGPGSSAAERGMTAIPIPLETSARTAPISVQTKALRGFSPSTSERTRCA